MFVPAGRRYRWEPFHFEECRAAKWNARKNKSGKRPVVYAMGRGMMDYKAKQTGAFCKGAAGGLRSGAEPVYPRREGGACPPSSPPPPWRLNIRNSSDNLNHCENPFCIICQKAYLPENILQTRPSDLFGRMEHWGPGTGDKRYVVCDSDHRGK